jgi:hypothetical protein
VHRRLRGSFPWNDALTDGARSFLSRWLEAMLSSGNGNGRSREPVLSPLAFRTAIDAKAWQEHLPLTVRATVDAARLRAEWKKRPFTAVHELATVTIDTLVECIPAPVLQPVLEAAEKALANRAQPDVDGGRVELTEEVPRA